MASLNRRNQVLVREASDGGDEGIGNSDAVRPLCLGLPHPLDRLPQSSMKADRDHQVPLTGGANQVDDTAGARG